jgi:hypothetical protein
MNNPTLSGVIFAISQQTGVKNIMNKELGFAIFYCIATIATAICIHGFGRAGAFHSVVEDCQKLGAFYIGGTVYECKEKKIDK